MIIPFLLCTSIVSPSQDNPLNIIKLFDSGTPTEVKVKKNIPTILCYQSIEKNKLDSIFHENQITVATATPNEFSWFSVKGVSTDDVHSHLETLVFGLLADERTEMKTLQPYERQSFLRDILSSCPNPLYSSSRNQCLMRFSSFGTACVTINSSADYNVEVSVRNLVFNEQRIYLLIGGIILFFTANTLSKSKLFQYTSGSFIFVIAGGMIGFFYLIQTLFRPRGRGLAIQWSDIFLGMAIGGGYGAGLLWFLKNNLMKILLEYWELGLGFLTLLAVIGLVIIRMVRRHEESKHTLSVLLKWCVRWSGIICAYNSSASPLGSLMILTVFCIGYFIYSCHKWITSRLWKTKSKKKKM